VEEGTEFVFVFYVSVGRQLSHKMLTEQENIAARAYIYTDQANGHMWANDMPKLIVLCSINGPVTV
jgi:hypothetical protein